MHPAPSVILFTTLSGLGFGFLAFLAGGLVSVGGWWAFFVWGLGYALAVGGLLASTFHLGNPQRFWRAFSQWRSSWLSREAVASVVTLIWLAPLALGDWLGFAVPPLWGWLGAALCLITIFTTSMIYAQLKTVPRWNMPATPLMFLAFAGTGGALLSGRVGLAMAALVVLGLVQAVVWVRGDTRFVQLGASMGTATGLGHLGQLKVFEQPHSHPNYLMREMIHVVGRKHAAKLRVIAFGLAVLAPLALVTLAPHGAVVLGLALGLHMVGAVTSRWLFFAEAEHVVGLYYGKR